MTTCSIYRNSDQLYQLRVVNQRAIFNSEEFVLYDIYGLENTTKDTEFCVICMSDEKNTLCIPCRHLCTCQECAQVLKFQSNKCPICRTPVRAMLHLKMKEKEKMEEDNVVDFDTESEEGERDDGEGVRLTGVV